MTVSRSVLRIIIRVSAKCFRESQNTHCIFDSFFFRKSWRYETMWKNMLEPERSQTTIWRIDLFQITNLMHNSFIL